MLFVPLFLLLVSPVVSVHAEDLTPRKPPPQRPLDPMNRPMNELGVTGHDTTLCRDRRFSCTTYDRRQFDQQYPGQPLNKLLRYREPNWPDRDRSSLYDSLDHSDRKNNGDVLHFLRSLPAIVLCAFLHTCRRIPLRAVTHISLLDSSQLRGLSSWGGRRLRPEGT